MSDAARIEGEAAVERLGPRGMLTLRGDFGAAAFRKAAAGVAGVDFPGVRRISQAGERALAWMSPDELLTLLPRDEVPAALDKLASELAGAHHLVADVSDARALFRLTGSGAREALAKGAPVDLAPGAFGPGDYRRTRLGQVAVAFWMTEDEAFELVCFRSVAGHVEEWLRMAARRGSLPGVFRAGGG